MFEALINTFQLGSKHLLAIGYTQDNDTIKAPYCVIPVVSTLWAVTQEPTLTQYIGHP